MIWAGCCLSAEFLRQQNGALSVEILYFLAGAVMHHSGVVNISSDTHKIFQTNPGNTLLTAAHGGLLYSVRYM
ncbi:hypothetical protein FA822_20925 [Escherichia coli]|nr:hypothetical protein [Escherichia coli]EFD4961822.1 hypothetical protein [Escherichia coli]